MIMHSPSLFCKGMIVKCIVINTYKLDFGLSQD